MAITFDPFDATHGQQAWPLLRRLRDEGPVATIGGGMRYVTRHETCRAVLRDTDAFSNASGMKAPGVEVPVADRILGELDPPLHSRVRRVMVTAITPKLVRRAEPFIRTTAEDLLDAVARRGSADLVAAFTVPLPNRVTVHLLGFPPADADMIATWAKQLMESGFPATNRGPGGEGFRNGFPAFAAYIDERIEERAVELERGDDRDDIVCRLLRLEVDGERLSRPQVRALTRNLITGGLTTTSQLLGNMVHELLTSPGLETAVRVDHDALAGAIEESLRLAPPVLFVARGCVRKTSIASCPVTPGERVIVGLASANRDERAFDDADSFVADRVNADHHLTFGYGPHVCPGAALARAVARVGLRALLDRFEPGSLRLVPGFEYENVPTFFECGPRGLPVEAGPVG